MRFEFEFLVGEFRVNPTLDEVSKDGGKTKLEPRTMRLLVCLAEHAGQVVSVEQLLDLVWKDVVVSPDSVYQAIASLRRILGDDPKEPHESTHPHNWIDVPRPDRRRIWHLA